ncbi:MAG TPA: hypothetical protein VMC04_19580, partial [Verrucomicrobiae bacterium]|nr:hypothetical protein [Verrucomicrobiae bacterium]
MKRARFCILIGLLVAILPVPAFAAPRILSDGQLDAITAGQTTPEDSPLTVGTQFNTGPIASQTVGTQQNVTNNLAVSRQPLPSLSPAGGSGGAILGDRSTATIETTGLVQLSDTVQQDLQGMNLVNAAESSVANGVNIWAARLAPQAASGLVPLMLNTQIHVDQINAIAQ